MTNDKKTLLEESIADAKELRSMALANAKKELMEAFEPRLKSMLSKVIENEVEDEEDEESSIEPEIVDDETGEEIADEGDEVVDDLDLDLDSEPEIDLEDEDLDSEEEIDLDIEDEEDLDEEINLFELEDEDSEEEIDLDTNEEDLDIDLDIEDEDSEEEIDLDIEDDEDLDEEDLDLDLDDEIDLDTNEEDLDIDLDIEDDEDDLEEAYQTIQELKDQIQEVNFLNYKLVLSNKIFNKFSLNRNQKVRIIESFDKTSTNKELKLVYNALVKNLDGISNKKTTKPTRTKLRESVSKLKTGTTKPKRKDIINEDIAKETISRTQFLAGIR